MTAAASAPASSGVVSSAGHWRQGVQLSGAVVAAYLVSEFLGLPESLWAVMSALIVMRPGAGSTLDAGLNRLKGTLAGTLSGLAGAWLVHLGANPNFTTLGAAAALALSTAWLPSLRSAPIAALIVLSGVTSTELSALHVAGLRVVEIGIGVATGLAISLFMGGASHARPAFDAVCVSVLRLIADSVADDLSCVPQTPSHREARAAIIRLAVRELSVFAVRADRNATLAQRLRGRRPGEVDECARIARLLARVSHDASLFARLAKSAPPTRDDLAWQSLGRVVSESLQSASNALENSRPAAFGALRHYCLQASENDSGESFAVASPLPWIAPAARLLMEDLVTLTRQRATATR